MRKFSDGSDATLGTLRQWAALFGEKAEAFVDQKIAESPNGEAEEVLADESQLIMLLSSLAAARKVMD
jgi:hypothetical protein